MTLPYEVLAQAFATAKRLKEEAPAGHARLMGIQMEGRFSREEKGSSERRVFAQPRL